NQWYILYISNYRDHKGSLIYYGHHSYLLSFPTRRSSDLSSKNFSANVAKYVGKHSLKAGFDYRRISAVGNDLDGSNGQLAFTFKDRKSTRLNSTHVAISYAVFCLKKKNTTSYTQYYFTSF